MVRWSPAAEELLGYAAPCGIGRTITELLAAGPPGHFGVTETAFRHQDGHAVGCRIRVWAERDPQFGACWRVELSAASSETVPAVDQALLEALFTRSPIGLFVLDPELRLTRYNAAAEGMQGTRVTEALGLRPTEAWPGFSSEMAEQVMAKVLETGEPAIAFEKRGRPPGDPEHEHVYSASVFRLQDSAGRIIGIADTVVDVSDQHRAQQRLALVAEAGARIGTTLDVLRTAQELAEVVVPRLADSVAVDLLEPVLAGHEVPYGPGEAGWALQRAACRSDRAGITPGVYAVGEPSNYPGAAAALRVLADRKACLVRSVDEDSTWIRDDMVRGRRILEERIHSLMMVPLVARESVLGLVAFYRWGARGAFDDEDLTLAQDLAGRTAVALDNARRFVRERNAVLSLQRGMLPQDSPAPHSVRTAHHVVYSGAGGDWADVIALPGARVGLVTGSAPGRGMRTAATMGRLRTAVHILAALDLAPDEVMARLDDVVHQMDAENGDPAAGSEAAGATCLYLVYNPVTRQCVMATAGRPCRGPAGRHGHLPRSSGGGTPGPARTGVHQIRADGARPDPPGAVHGRTGAGLRPRRRTRRGHATARRFPSGPAGPVPEPRREPHPRRPSAGCGGPGGVHPGPGPLPRRHLEPARRPGGRGHRPHPCLGPTERVGPGRRGLRHRTHRQRTGHQRHPVRRTARTTAADLRSHPDL
nr:PAS domain-containing protein [Streptomyces sp. RPA4-2]